MSADLHVLLDVGNTTAVVGVYRKRELIAHFRLSTDADRTADEYRAILMSLFSGRDIDPAKVGRVVISSVVPPLRLTLDNLARELFGGPPLFVEPGIETGLPLRYENPAEIGADRIVNAVAARALYGTPVVVVDFGTATTFDVINQAGEYVGGLIAPGLGISSEALFARASRLYRVDIREPEKLVGRTTAEAMQSGIYHGYIGLIDGILERLIEEIPDIHKIVATGGLAELLSAGSKHIDEVNPLLTLEGLRRIDELNP